MGTVNGPPIERGAAPDTPPAADVNVAGKDAGKDMGKDQGKGPDDKNVDKGELKGPDPQDKNNDKNNDKDKNNATKDEPKPMVVPPEAKQKQELGFLKGDWRSRTGLATATGEKDIAPVLHARRQGQGQGLASCSRTARPARRRPRRAGTTASW